MKRVGRGAEGKLYSNCNLPEHTASEHLRLGGKCFRNGLIAVNANRAVVLFIDDALHAAIAAAVGLQRKREREKIDK